MKDRFEVPRCGCELSSDGEAIKYCGVHAGVTDIAILAYQLTGAPWCEHCRHGGHAGTRCEECGGALSRATTVVSSDFR